jgi:hypothetical protein
MPARAEAHELIGVRGIGSVVVVGSAKAIDVDENRGWSGFAGERMHGVGKLTPGLIPGTGTRAYP